MIWRLQPSPFGGANVGAPGCTNASPWAGRARFLCLVDVLEAVQERLDANPQAMRVRRETAEHPFATLKMRMGATHFLMKTLPRVATEMALHVLAYNLTRVMNIMGIQPLMAAIQA